MIEILKQNNKPIFAVVPFKKYEEMLEAYEEFQDTKEVEKFKMSKHKFFPEEIALRIIKEDNPIKIYREFLGITQENLAKDLKVSKQFISQIETNKTAPSLKILKRIAERLDMSVDDLI